MSDELLAGAREVASRLREHDYEAYFAGGCVRDMLLGHKPKDYDIVTDARPVEVQRLFRRTVNVGASFGVVRVLISGRREYEVATYRRDGDYTDGRRPDEVEYSDSKEEDVHRRDFTINALLMEPETGEVLDYVGGKADLGAHLIRAVGDPARRFAEDRLRMLRAVRFSARFGFELDLATFSAIAENARHLAQVSAERIVTEVHALWATERPALGAELLEKTGLLPFVFPALGEVPRYLERQHRFTAHGISPLELQIVGWALVMSGVADAESALRAHKLSRDHVRGALALLAEEARLRDPAALSLAERVRVAKEDMSTQLAFLRALGEEAAAARWEAERAALAEDPLPALPLVSGADLSALGFAPGPRFKEILLAVEDEIFERRLHTREEALAFVRERFGAPP